MWRSWNGPCKRNRKHLDGSTRELRGRGDFVMGLFAGACGGAELSSRQAEQLELIRQSVSAQEPCGAHMTDLLRCFLNGPAEAQSSAVEQPEIASDIVRSLSEMTRRWSPPGHDEPGSPRYFR